HELRFSPDGSCLAVGLGGRSGIRIWRSIDWQQIGEDHDYDGKVYALNFAKDGQLATTSYDGLVRLYDADLRLTRKAKAPGGVRPYGIAFSPDGKNLAVGYDDTTKIDILSVDTLTRRYSADTSGINNGNLASVSWSADGRTLFSGGLYIANG